MTVAGLITRQHFECKKDRLAQNQDGTWKVTLTVAAVDMPAALLQASPGTRYVAALVEVADNETPIAPTEATAEPEATVASLLKLRRAWAELGPTQQSAIRCQEPMFQRFVAERGDFSLGQDPEQAAARYVKWTCRVASRKELETSLGADDLWRKLDDTYFTWKRYPERR